MKKCKAVLAIALISATQLASAALPAGAGGGYYGSAWYSSNQGSVVGPYSNWYDCNEALQNAMDNAVYNFGWSIVSVNPCSYNPPAVYGQVLHELAPVESLNVVNGILDQVAAARKQWVPEYFEQAICDITDPDEDEDFDKEEVACPTVPRR